VKWFDRKFDFTFSAEQLPIVLVRLQGAPARLEEMLRSVSPAVLQAKPEGQWSAQEHAGHLVDLESLWQVRVEDFAASRETLTAADLTNRKTHEAAHNTRALSEILTRVETLPPDVFSSTIPHPRLQQPMRFVDHLYFVAEHDDHHLARIREMIAAEC
jgi:hypothetical protein